jgi:hypothetical protein
MGLAYLLNKVVSPVVLGAIYYAAVTPLGVGRRLLGKDPMQRRFAPHAASYWIPRQPPGPSPESLRDQF